MTNYNIYFGLRGGELKIKYQFTEECKSEKEAKQLAHEAATAFYYKNEGTHHLPSLFDIQVEADITGKSLESLYKEHINDCVLYFVVPSDLDSEVHLHYR